MYGGDIDFVVFLGWEVIWQNIVDYIWEYFEFIVVLEVEVDYYIEYFGKIVWVFYIKKILQGMACEVCFMVCEKGVWKIVCMQMIYVLIEQY